MDRIVLYKGDENRLGEVAKQFAMKHGIDEESEMKLNPDKFELMRMGTDLLLKEETNYSATDGSAIKRKTSLRDLGVIFSEDGTFDAQIEGLRDLRLSPRRGDSLLSEGA